MSKTEKIKQLALEVQLSIARLDRLQDTMKLVAALCEQITGIASPFNIDELNRNYQKKQQQEAKRAVATLTQKKKRKRGRPKKSRTHKPDNDPLRQQIDAAFRKKES